MGNTKEPLGRLPLASPARRSSERFPRRGAGEERRREGAWRNGGARRDTGCQRRRPTGEQRGTIFARVGSEGVLPPAGLSPLARPGVGGGASLPGDAGRRPAQEVSVGDSVRGPDGVRYGPGKLGPRDVAPSPGVCQDSLLFWLQHVCCRVPPPHLQKAWSCCSLAPPSGKQKPTICRGLVTLERPTKAPSLDFFLFSGSRRAGLPLFPPLAAKCRAFAASLLVPRKMPGLGPSPTRRNVSGPRRR